MFCSNCGYDNKDSSRFCEQCGSSLEGASTVLNELDEGKTQEIEAIAIPDQEVNVSQETQGGVKKKSKAPLVIGLVVLFVVLIGAGVVLARNLMKSDEERLIEAMISTQAAPTKVVSGEFGIDEFNVEGLGITEAALAENIVKGLKVQFQVKSDIEAYQVEGYMNVVMSGTDLLRVNYFINKEYIALQIPVLYNKVIYLDWKDIDDVLVKYGIASEEEMQNFDIDPDRTIELIDAYVQALDVRDFTSYEDFDKSIITDYMYGMYNDDNITAIKDPYEMEILGENMTFNGTQYLIDFDYGDNYDKMIELYNRLLNDEAVVPMMKEAIDRFLATVVDQEDDFTYNVLMTIEDQYREPVWGWQESNATDLDTLKVDLYDLIDTGYDDAKDEFLQSFQGEDYEAMSAFMKDVFSEVDTEMTMVVEDKKLVAQDMHFSVNDSIIDAINDYSIQNAEVGQEVSMIEDMNLLFNLGYYIRTVYEQIDQPVDFQSLPADAVDFANLDQMELMNLYQEIMTNAQSLVGGFSGMY